MFELKNTVCTHFLSFFRFQLLLSQTIGISKLNLYALKSYFEISVV